MEPTLTQTSALFFTQHKTSTARRALFRQFRADARNHKPARQQQLKLQALTIPRRHHVDNGR